MAEWLGGGLQSPLRGFDSPRCLHRCDVLMPMFLLILLVVVKAQDTIYWVQLIASRNYESVYRYRASLTGILAGDKYRDTVVLKDDYYKLWIGPAGTYREAVYLRNRLRTINPDCFIVRQVGKPRAKSSHKYYIQVGAFATTQNLLSAKRRAQAYIPDINWFSFKEEMSGLNKLVAGPFISRKEAQAYLVRIREIFPYAFITSNVPEVSLSSEDSTVRVGRIMVTIEKPLDELVGRSSGMDQVSVYRIQLAETHSYGEALRRFTALKRRFADSIPVYLVYMEPNYSIQAGNFTSFVEASMYRYRFMQEFPRAVVVKVRVPLEGLAGEDAWKR